MKIARSYPKLFTWQCALHSAPFTAHRSQSIYCTLTVNSPCAHRLFRIQISFSMILYLGHFFLNKLFYGSDILQYWEKKMKYPFNPFSFYYRRPNFCQSFKKSEMSVRGLNFTYCRNDFSWDFQAWFWFQTSYQIKFTLLYERWTSFFFQDTIFNCFSENCKWRTV